MILRNVKPVMSEQCRHKGLQWIKTQGKFRVCRRYKPAGRLNSKTRGMIFQVQQETVKEAG